ncbi:9282_t:CDS:2 [Scutellospora calospora]|uniref:9282_t:CDS:1 n=1 Tax=Scutellospora calospora TaxID=85575 RepID=A0ACA9JUV5_9GLOM|nr:9282_t:CDS:2 [Scutellospora calospora]
MREIGNFPESDIYRDNAISKQYDMFKQKMTREYTKKACIECSRSKRKCKSDTLNQTCQRCIKEKLNCIYPNKQKKRGPKPNNSKKKRDSEIKRVLKSIVESNYELVKDNNNDKMYLRFEVTPEQLSKLQGNEQNSTSNTPIQPSAAVSPSNDITSNNRTDDFTPWNCYSLTDNDVNGIQGNFSTGSGYDFQSPLPFNVPTDPYQSIYTIYHQ